MDNSAVSPLQKYYSLVPNSLSREEFLRSQITKKEAAYIIEQKYQSKYDPYNLNFDAFDQLLACESVAESSPISPRETNEKESISTNGNVSGNDNGVCKQQVSHVLTQSKRDVISKLMVCNYLTPPLEVSKLLESLFEEYSSQEGHWLWISQRWTPRAINRSVKYTFRLYETGRIRQNPAACFTYDIKHRKQRRNKNRIV